MPRKSNSSSSNEVIAAPSSTTDIIDSNIASTCVLGSKSAASLSTKTTAQDDQALKNINYKNMLLTGNYGMIKPDIVTHPNIDAILENEKNTNKSDPWNKLDKSAKVVKLKDFASRHGKEHELTDRETTALYQFLLSNLEQKKLVRAKDVIYDKVTGLIASIPCLLFNSALKKFTLKRCDKRQSTLKSLAPTGMSKKRKLVVKSGGATGNGNESHHSQGSVSSAGGSDIES
jgi:hypothetical protein